VLAVGGDNIIRIYNIETKNSFVLDRISEDFKINSAVFSDNKVIVAGNKNYLLFYNNTYQKHQKYFQILKYFINNFLKKSYANDEEDDNYYDKMILPKKYMKAMTISIQYNINFINFLFKIQNL